MAGFSATLTAVLRSPKCRAKSNWCSGSIVTARAWALKPEEKSLFALCHEIRIHVVWICLQCAFCPGMGRPSWQRYKKANPFLIGSYDSMDRCIGWLARPSVYWCPSDSVSKTGRPWQTNRFAPYSNQEAGRNDPARYWCLVYTFTTFFDQKLFACSFSSYYLQNHFSDIAILEFERKSSFSTI